MKITKPRVQHARSLLDHSCKDKINKMKITKTTPQHAHLWIAVAARGKGRLALTVNAHVSDWAEAEEIGMLFPVARKKYF